MYKINRVYLFRISTFWLWKDLDKKKVRKTGTKKAYEEENYFI